MSKDSSPKDYKENKERLHQVLKGIKVFTKEKKRKRNKQWA